MCARTSIPHKLTNRTVDVFVFMSITVSLIHWIVVAVELFHAFNVSCLVTRAS